MLINDMKMSLNCDSALSPLFTVSSKIKAVFAPGINRRFAAGLELGQRRFYSITQGSIGVVLGPFVTSQGVDCRNSVPRSDGNYGIFSFPGPLDGGAHNFFLL